MPHDMEMICGEGLGDGDWLVRVGEADVVVAAADVLAAAMVVTVVAVAVAVVEVDAEGVGDRDPEGLSDADALAERPGVTSVVAPVRAPIWLPPVPVPPVAVVWLWDE